MKTKYFLVALTLLALLAMAGAVSAAASQTAAEPQDGGLMFVENVGQFDPQVRFQAQGANCALWVKDEALWVTMQDEQQGVALKLSFVGAAPRAVEPFGLLETRFGYFLGNDPDQWYPNVPVWSGVRFVDLYPGIDLELAGKGGQLAQKLVVREATHLGEVELMVEGADAVAEAAGKLLLTTPLGAFTTPGLTLEGVGSAMEPRVITPDEMEVPDLGYAPSHNGTLVWSTYLGGTSADRAWDVDDDNYGNSYVCGSTTSANFPKKSGSFDVTLGGAEDAFLVKYHSTTGKVLYSSFLGGGGADFCRAIYVKGNGPVYLTGGAWSADFPTTFNAYDRTLDGGRDVFVAVMMPTTDLVPVYQLLYSTYLGGTNWEYGFAIEADDAAGAYVCGYTHGGFPTKNPAQPASGGGGEAFVTKLDTSPLRPAGDDGLRWSTYLGGSGNDACDGIEEQAGNIYVVGGTGSPGMSFPTTAGVFDRNCVNCVGDSAGDAYVVKYNASTGARLLSTLIGNDQAKVEVLVDVEADSTGKVFAVGFTSDSTFPTTGNAYDTTLGGTRDAVVVVLNSNFATLAYSSFFGGSSDDFALDLDHNANHIYLTGGTNSTNLPVVSPMQAANAGGFDAFVAWLDTSLAGAGGLVFSTYWGGAGDDNVFYEAPDKYFGIGGLERDDLGTLYLAGTTTSTNFPTLKPAQATNKGATDGFVTKMKVVP